MNNQEIKYESWNVCRVGCWFAVQYREKQPALESVEESMEVFENETTDQE